ncbi:MAG: efflux RND transporter periplasmic adaptor subunit [Blastocatellia bacterium]|nr:efflux RND transporter periplasmic adaptor subunit [Blastocatellia bacterium]
MKKQAILIGALVVVALVIGALVFVNVNANKKTGLVLSGTVESHEIQVGSKVGGRISEVLVVEGQPVKAGDVLVRFDIEELKTQRKQLEARALQAEANLAKLTKGFRPEEVAQAEAAEKREAALFEEMKNGARPQERNQARADLEVAQAEATNASLAFQRTEKLIKTGDISQQAYDTAKARLDGANQRVESLKQRLALLEAGNRAEDIRAAEARFHQAEQQAKMMRSGSRREDIAAANAQLQEIRAMLEQNAVLLKEGAVVAAVDSRVEILSVRPGDIIPPGKPVATLLEASQLWVRVYVPEPELGKVTVGQRAGVKVDTFPSREFPGRVQQISNQAEFLPRNIQTRSERNHQVFGIKIQIDNQEQVLKPGMSAEVVLY